MPVLVNGKRVSKSEGDSVAQKSSSGCEDSSMSYGLQQLTPTPGMPPPTAALAPTIAPMHIPLPVALPAQASTGSYLQQLLMQRERIDNELLLMARLMSTPTNLQEYPQVPLNLVQHHQQINN